MRPRSCAPTASHTSWIVSARSPTWPASIGPPDSTTAGRSTRASAISAAGTVLSQPTRQTTASKSCAWTISSIESAITSRETSEARMPGVACDWLSETAIVLNSSATPPAASTAAATPAASRRWLRLHGIVPVHVEAMPTIGPSSRSGSIPIDRKCERAPARPAPERSAARARRRTVASSIGPETTRGGPWAAPRVASTPACASALGPQLHLGRRLTQRPGRVARGQGERHQCGRSCCAAAPGSRPS